MSVLSKNNLKNMFNSVPEDLPVPRSMFTNLVDSMAVPGVPVTISADWATVGNAVTDVVAACGFTFATGWSLVLTLWEGTGDTDDYATLTITSSGGTWTQAFASAPTSGTAYILGATVTYSE